MKNSAGLFPHAAFNTALDIRDAFRRRFAIEYFSDPASGAFRGVFFRLPFISRDIWIERWERSVGFAIERMDSSTIQLFAGRIQCVIAATAQPERASNEGAL
ncbi:hypothetical protein DEM27_12415 [Metarhizobium album]|uniref:Uncharacterized protein n=1 Tax=Metarhizobium album TaxID=2182425 RepID=A0A2U2DSC8_9HYPH|nr:hypothetical protein [Rhizobium album]PWE56223.1 hypothetical protein DEM27_12415 [Rhizobium album]